MTQPSKLQIAEHQHSDIAVVTLSGEMIVDDGDLAFGRYLDQMVAAGRCKIIVDLSNVTYMDSAAVGMLVAKQKAVQRHGGAMRLAHLTAKSHHLFAMLKLKLVFEIYEDVDAAIRSFAWRPR